MRFPVDYIDVKGFFYDGNNINFGYCPESPYVYSVDDGEVIYSQHQSKYNNVIFIKHNNGLISMYKRLENTYVKLGQKVKNGERIGVVGSTIGSGKKFLLFGLFSEDTDYLNGQSDLDPFDYLYLYSNQEVTNSTISKYGVKLKYYESNSDQQNLLYKELYKEKSSKQNTLLVDKNYYKIQIKNNLSYGIGFIFLLTIFCLLLFIAKRNKKVSSMYGQCKN